MTEKKDLIHRMADALMVLIEEYDVEAEDPALYREVMDLLDELADGDLFPQDDFEL
jgi:hypothetical protein